MLETDALRGTCNQTLCLNRLAAASAAGLQRDFP
jgi:hypothetical protein